MYLLFEQSTAFEKFDKYDCVENAGGYCKSGSCHYCFVPFTLLMSFTVNQKLTAEHSIWIS